METKHVTLELVEGGTILSFEKVGRYEIYLVERNQNYMIVEFMHDKMRNTDGEWEVIERITNVEIEYYDFKYLEIDELRLEATKDFWCRVYKYYMEVE